MPGDLNLKKSWNPALMKNQKKVWEREQEALKEHQAIKQRAKEIEAEREKEEMIRLQYGNDSSNMPQQHKLELNKLGWMYNEGPKDAKVNESGFREVNEDFLANSDEIQSLLQGNKAIKSTVGSRFDRVASVGVSRQARSLNDDPLLMIKKEQRSKQRDARERSPTRHTKERSGRDEERNRDRRSHRDSSHRSSSHRESSHRESSHRESSHRDSSHRDSSHRDSSHRSSSHRSSSHRGSSDRDRTHSRSHSSKSSSRHPDQKVSETT